MNLLAEALRFLELAGPMLAIDRARGRQPHMPDYSPAAKAALEVVRLHFSGEAQPATAAGRSDGVDRRC